MGSVVPLVSVIVPIYNSESSIELCLKSLVNQTLQNIEIILINDGSIDSSEDICKRFQRNDERIIYIFQANSGVSSARNNGLKAAKGEYIAFCDSDDTYSLDALEILYKNAITYNSDWVVGKVKKIKSGIETVTGSFQDACYYSNDKSMLIVSLVENYLINQVWGKLYKRKIIQDNSILFDNYMTCGEDHEWNCKYLLNTNVISTSDHIVYNYQIDDSISLSTKFKEGHFKYIEKEFAAAKHLFLKENLWDQYGDLLAFQQIDSYIAGFLQVLKKDCVLSFKDKIIYLDNGMKSQNYDECIRLVFYKLPKKKRVYFYVKNSIFIILLVYINFSLKKIKGLFMG